MKENVSIVVPVFNEQNTISRAIADVSSLPFVHELIIVPSQVGEGFSFVTLEALVCGCKVVASGLPAIKEVARDYAVYAKPGDLDDFTNKILHTLRSPHKQVNEIRKYVQESLSWTNHIDKLIEVYKNNIECA